jgi:hypothetical protein
LQPIHPYSTVTTKHVFPSIERSICAKMTGGGKPNQVLARALFCDSLERSREALFDPKNHLIHDAVTTDTVLAIINRERCDTNLDYVIRVLKKIDEEGNAGPSGGGGGGGAGSMTASMVLETVCNPECPSLSDVITKKVDEMNQECRMGDTNALPNDMLHAASVARGDDHEGGDDYMYKKEMDLALALYAQAKAETERKKREMGFNDVAMQPLELRQPHENEGGVDGLTAPGTPFRYTLLDGESESSSSSSSSSEDGDEDDEDEAEGADGDDTSSVEFKFPWTHPCVSSLDELPGPYGGYSWFVTLWYRVNLAEVVVTAQKRLCGRNKLLDYKVCRFVQRTHLKAVQYMDSLEDPCDANVDPVRLAQCYGEGMGKSYFHDDRDAVTTTFTRHTVKRTPLSRIRERYPDLLWTADDAAYAIKTNKIPHSEVDGSRIDGEWAPFPGAPVATHLLYYGCIYVMNQCQRLMDEHRDESGDGHLFDALWAYYAAFADIFYFCLATHPTHKPRARMDDEYLLTPMDGFTAAASSSCSSRTPSLVMGDRASPWELYGQCMDTRAFHAGDLPDLFHVLVHIPLWGEQNKPSSIIGQLMQKSLPFACQRRRLIRLIVNNIDTEPGFWIVFCKLYWVMLAGLYPGELGPKENKLGMRELLRAKELTDPVHGKQKLVEALEAQDDVNAGGGSTANGGPLVVFTSFRLFILYMGALNPHYVEAASRCVSWDMFKADVIHMAFLIRGHNLFPADPFAQARRQLSRTIKNPGGHVHRLRRRSLSQTMREYCNVVLEKHILRDMQQRRKDLRKLRGVRSMIQVCGESHEEREVCINGFFSTRVGQKYTGGRPVWSSFESIVDRAIEVQQNALEFYNSILNIGVKSAIVNILLRLPPSERLSLNACSMLTLPEYGGIGQQSVATMMELLDVYHEKAVPKEFAWCLDTFDMRDFMVVCFYFNMVALLDQYKLVTLDAETVRRTDMAMMTERHKIYPRLQRLPDSVYEINIALCCDKVCNLRGQGQYGDKKVAFDVNRRMFVCIHGKAAAATKGKRSAAASSSSAIGNDSIKHDLRNLTNPAVVRINAMRKGAGGGGDLVSQSSAEKGRGTKRTQQMKERKELRNERKGFSSIPCGQPVISVSLRGRMLVYGSTLETQTRTMFCPECGALHTYSMMNYVGSEVGHEGLYRCNECAQKELMSTPHLSCAYCHKSTPGQVSRKTLLEVFCPLSDPSNPTFDPVINGDGVFQWLYFCRGHYSIARRYAWGIPKRALWKKIAAVQAQKLKEVAMGKYTQRKRF